MVRKYWVCLTPNHAAVAIAPNSQASIAASFHVIAPRADGADLLTDFTRDLLEVG